MFGIGFGEMLVIGVLALVFLGPEQLPKIAVTLGKFLRDFKRAGESFRQEFQQGAPKPLNTDLRHAIHPLTRVLTDELNDAALAAPVTKPPAGSGGGKPAP